MKRVFAALSGAVVVTALHTGRGIVAGTNLTVAPCQRSSSQQLVVNNTDSTVRSTDGSLCVTWIGDSPAPLQMNPCLGNGALSQVGRGMRRVLRSHITSLMVFPHWHCSAGHTLQHRTPSKGRPTRARRASPGTRNRQLCQLGLALTSPGMATLPPTSPPRGRSRPTARRRRPAPTRCV